MSKLQVLQRLLSHRQGKVEAPPKARTIAIVGSPNVGKSVLFNALTGAHVIVSNYPGTTVEVSRGPMRLGDETIEVVDTPGMYSLSPITEEERVARTLLRKDGPALVLHVVDAKNLGRMLPVTLQLLEAGLPLMLIINIMDEATRLGITIDCARLEKELGIPVIPTVSVTGEGIDILRSSIADQLAKPASFSCALCSHQCKAFSVERSALSANQSHPGIRTASAKIAELLQGNYGLTSCAIANLLLSEDTEMLELAEALEGKNFPAIRQEIESAKVRLVNPPAYMMLLDRQETANQLIQLACTPATQAPAGPGELLSRWMMRPLTGLPILFLVLFFGLYLFVGRLGAGILVDVLQNKLFHEHLNPYITQFIERIIPWSAVQDLFVHEYGMITLGLTYALAIILPIVATFFLVFSIIEDTGYLPRLALLIDKLFKTIGLSGRAVIPMVLGLGCDTMATLVTRVLETRRERIIATLLLALAVPCSAQLGVVLGLLSGAPLALAIWALVIGSVFLITGFLSSRLIKGEASSFYIEVPPLRGPKFKNILSKTFARMKWYFLEITPLFIGASFLIWTGRQFIIFGHSLFDWTLRGLEPLVVSIGLPREAALSFLFGFFRRDYGAAGLYDLHTKGLLGGIPLVVAMVTLTLFLPCIAQWLIMLKERGLKTTLAICAFIFPFAWLVGFSLNYFLHLLKVKL
jgi:ferrous iron transport protein B